MRLVAMLGVCALLAWPSSGGARPARPVLSEPKIAETTMAETAMAETAPLEQDSPPAPPESKTDPRNAVPQTAEPAPQSPPPSGTQSGTTPPPAEPETHSRQTSAPPAPAATEAPSETEFHRRTRQPPSPQEETRRGHGYEDCHARRAPRQDALPECEPQESRGAEWRHQ